ncbi:MAG: lytic murein transglycosylase B, partial [Neisseria elongata]
MKKTLPLFAAALILAACSSEQKPASEPVVRQTTVTPVQQMPKFDESAASVSLVGFNGNDNVQRFIDFEAANGRYNKAELQAFFNGVVYKPN